MSLEETLFPIETPPSVSFQVDGPILDDGGYLVFRNNEIEDGVPADQVASREAWQADPHTPYLARIKRRLADAITKGILPLFSTDGHPSVYDVKIPAPSGAPYTVLAHRDPLAIGIRRVGDDFEIVSTLLGKIGDCLRQPTALGKEIVVLTGRSPRMACLHGREALDDLAGLTAHILWEADFGHAITTGASQVGCFEKVADATEHRRSLTRRLINGMYALNERDIHAFSAGDDDTWRLYDLEIEERIEIVSLLREAYEAGALHERRLLVAFYDSESGKVSLVDPEGETVLAVEEHSISKLQVTNGPAPVPRGSYGDQVLRAMTIRHEIADHGVVTNHDDWLAAGGRDLTGVVIADTPHSNGMRP